MQCFPSIFPRAKFEEAQRIQEIYNRLYCSIASDPEWIYNTIKDLLPVDFLAKALWSIYEATCDVGPVQDVSVGIFRSDYMLHIPSPSNISWLDDGVNTLKQVEFNTFSCAGAAHANKVADMHRYMSRTGAYPHLESSDQLRSLAVNKNIESLASCLVLAHKAYGPSRSKEASRTAVLFVVQPRNVSNGE